jgi:hypothetical protein
MGTINCIVLIYEDDRQQEFVGLVEGVKHFVARYRDGTRSDCAAFHFDVTGIGLLAVHGGRIRGDIPATLLTGDIYHSAATGLLGSSNGVHGKLFDAGARGGINGKGRAILYG